MVEHPHVAIPVLDRRVGPGQVRDPEYVYGVHVEAAGESLTVQQRVQDEDGTTAVDDAACAAVATAPGGFCHRDPEGPAS